VGSAWADLYKVDCEIDQKPVEVMVLQKESIDSSDAKSGVFFYAHNYNKSSFFVILLSEAKDLSLESSSEIVRDGLEQVFGKSDFKMKNIDPVKVPESSILLVGNVDKHEFVKIAPNEKISDLKKRLDPLLALGNSLTFRGGAFQGNDFENVNARSVLPGDVIIAPVRNALGSGENFYRMDHDKGTGL
jgi:hypothetical protein